MPSRALAGIPIEVLLAARPVDSPRYLVSYAPSGTMFAWLQERRREEGERPLQSRSLLALGDALPPPPDQPPSLYPEPPEHGLLVKTVQPRSNGERAGIRHGDVLLAYSGAELATIEDLEKRVQAVGTKAPA